MTFGSVRVIAAVICALLATGSGIVAVAAVPVDYSTAGSWVCRPGQEGACTRGLDALIVSADGARRVQTFTPSTAPPIDCFYIYPTVSEENSTYSDLRRAPEIVDITRNQVGRLTAQCRLFAPIYRQLTGRGLSAVLSAHGTPDWHGPYADVLAAWRWYRAHENGGRGVVLIGHSQGAILLQRLLSEQIDAQPDQHVLLAAFLAGDLSLPVPRNAVSGGALQHIPLCTAGAQTGCVYVWASYRADDGTQNRLFGQHPPGRLMAACASPAAPGGGMGLLKAYFPKPRSAPDGDPAWIVVEEQLSGRCVDDGRGNVLRVAIKPGRFTGAMRSALRVDTQDDPPGWGLHAHDLELLQGNVLDRVAQETSVWLDRTAAHPH